MKPIRALLALGSLGLILAGLYQILDVRTPDRPVAGFEQIEGLRDRDDLNLVVVVVDTLRADRLSAYGYERPTSPILAAVAGSGIRFENTLAQSTWTKSSMASMVTATYPARNRITRFNHGLPDGATLPSEILQRAGLRTVGIWRNGWVAGNFGFDQGFDVYVKPTPRGHRRNLEQNPSAARLTGTDQSVIEAATQFLRSSGDERFYLYLHLMDVHQYVYDGAVEFGTSFSDIYDQSIHFVDANIGTLIAVLQQQGLMKKTVFAVVSDHGEAFHEHGHEGHARSLYDETTRVPFVIALPFRLEEPIVVRTPVENVDVFPTLLDLLGMPPLPEADGRSAVPLILAAGRGEEPEADGRVRFAHLDTAWGRPSEKPAPLVLVQEGPHRLHQPAAGPPELYDQSADPGEQENLRAAQPERVRALQARIDAYADVPVPPWGGPERVEINELDAQHLRALGYVVDPHEPAEKRKLER